MSVIAFEWNEISGVGDELVKIRTIREIVENSPYFIEHNSREMPPQYKYNAEDFVGRLIWYMYVANRVAYTVSYKENADIFPANEDNSTQYNKQEALDMFSSLMYNIYTQGGQVFLSEEWLSVAQEIKEYAQKNDPNYEKGGDIARISSYGDLKDELNKLDKSQLKYQVGVQNEETKEYNPIEKIADLDRGPTLEYDEGGDLEKAGMGGYDEQIIDSTEDKFANSIIDNTKVAKPFRAIGEGGSSMIIGDSQGESRKKKQKIAAAIFAPHKLYAMHKADKQNKSVSEEFFKRGGITKDKAKLMLEDGVANGKPLTDKQKRYFRAISNDAKYSEGGYTKKGVKLRTALSQMKNVKEANGMFVYNPYYEKWGWINDEQLDKGILPYRVAIHYKKNDTLGKGSLENVNDLIVVREGHYEEGGCCSDKEAVKREKSRNTKKMKKGGSVWDSLNKKWNLQEELIYLEEQLKDVQSELDSLFLDMNHEAGQKGSDWTDDDGNRYGELMNKVETRKESIKKLIKEKTEKWEELEQS
jgi:hypothetical protein